MATPKSKKHTAGSQPSPPLDDKRWLTLTMAHHIRSEQLTGKRFSPRASSHLMEALKSGKLRCRRESRKDSNQREPVLSSFWQGLRIHEDPDGGIIQLQRDRASQGDPPRDLGQLYDWAYDVWMPDFDKLWPSAKTDQKSEAPARRKSKHRQPSQSPEGEQRRLRPSNRIHSELQRKSTTPKKRQVPYLKRQEAPSPRSEEARRQSKRKRRKGGGMKRILTDAQVNEGKKLYRDMLADDPRWAKRLASAVHVKKKLNLGASPRTVQRRIIDPVLNDER